MRSSTQEKIIIESVKDKDIADEVSEVVKSKNLKNENLKLSNEVRSLFLNWIVSYYQINVKNLSDQKIARLFSSIPSSWYKFQL